MPTQNLSASPPSPRTLRASLCRPSSTSAFAFLLLGKLWVLCVLSWCLLLALQLSLSLVRFCWLRCFFVACCGSSGLWCQGFEAVGLQVPELGWGVFSNKPAGRCASCNGYTFASLWTLVEGNALADDSATATTLSFCGNKYRGQESVQVWGHCAAVMSGILGKLQQIC